MILTNIYAKQIVPMADAHKNNIPSPLPRRDLFLIPLIVILTSIILLVAGEISARFLFPMQIADSCIVPDPVLGVSVRANCHSRSKALEGPWVENHYNECASRSETSCTKHPDNIRIVAFGESISQGYLVPYSESYPVRLANMLGATCHRTVDSQNVAVPGYAWTLVELNLERALQLNPDLLIMSVTPFNLEEDPERKIQNSAPQTSDGVHAIISDIKQSRLAYVAQSFYAKNGDRFAEIYLKYGEKANFLRAPLSPFWQDRLKAYDHILEDISNRAHAAAVPLVLVYVPQRAQAILMKNPLSATTTLDPRILARHIHELAEKHDIIFVDSSENFASSPHPGDNYYPVDGHPNATGHAVIAQAIASAFRADPLHFKLAQCQ